MIEAAVLREVDGGITEVWARCHNCHNDTMLLTNRKDRSEGQPFCMCATCGEQLFDDGRRDDLVKLVVDHGWNRVVPWLMSLKKRGG